MMFTSNKNRGFTFVEVLVALAVIVIIAGVSMVALQNFSRASALKVATQEVYTALTGARASTLASEGDTVFGVRVSTSSVTRFVGTTYVAGSATNETYVFEGGVSATGTLVTSGTSIIFERLTGESSASGDILLRNNTKDSTTTLHIYASGLVE